MSEKLLARAKELIKARKFDEARAVLRKMPNSQTAQRWLEKLDEIAPEPFPLDEAVEVKQKPSHVRQFMKAGAILLLICIVGSYIVLTLAESSQRCRDMEGEEKIECIVDREVNDVQQVEVESDKITILYRIDQAFAIRSTAQEDIVDLICELREGGFRRRSFDITADVKLVDQFGDEEYNTGVSVLVTASDSSRINCDNRSSVNIELIAEEYYEHPSIR